METLWMTLFVHKHIECLWISQQWWGNGWLMRLTSLVTSVVLKENKKIAKCFTIITSKLHQKHQRREKKWLSAFIYIKLMLIWFHTTIGAYPSSIMCLNNLARTPYMFPYCACILSTTTKLWNFFSISIQLIPVSFATPFPSFS